MKGGRMWGDWKPRGVKLETVANKKGVLAVEPFLLVCCLGTFLACLLPRDLARMLRFAACALYAFVLGGMITIRCSLEQLYEDTVKAKGRAEIERKQHSRKHYGHQYNTIMMI
jgi:hypothetical protein